MKTCLITNLAPHYREEIYTLLDSELTCDFVVGHTLNNGIKNFDTSSFKNKVTVLKNIQHGEVTIWQKGVLRFLFKDYDNYIVADDIRCFSTWIFMILSRILNKKVYYWAHGWYGREGVFKSLLKRVFYRLPKGIFLYGNYSRDIMIKNGFNSSNLWVIHNSLSYSKQIRIRESISSNNIYSQHFLNNDPTIIYIGRLTSYKRLDMLIDAIYALNSQKTLCNLVFVGDGPEKEKLITLSKKHNIETRVWFYGECYDEFQNAQLISSADVCVSPGNIGLTAIHVMMYGTPAITHDCFQFQGPEFEAIKPGVTGEFYKYGDQKSLETTICEWFHTQSQRREEIRQACYAEVDTNWTPEYQLKIIKEHLQ